MRKGSFTHKVCSRFTAAILLSALCLAGCTDMADRAPHAPSYVSEEAVSAAALSVAEAAEVLRSPVLPADSGADADSPSLRTDTLFEALPDETKATGTTPGDATGPGAVSGSADSSAAAKSTAAAKSAAVANGTILTAGGNDPEGVRILFLGDGQYTEGRGTGTEIPALVCKKVKGPCTVYNLAIPGSTASQDTGTRDMALDDWNSTSLIGMAHLLKGDVSTDMFEYNHPDLVDALAAIDRETIDYIVMDYGINDYLNSKQIYDDDDGDDPTDFSPAYRRGLSLLQEACPRARILCCTPCYSQFYGKDGALLGEGSSLSNSFGNLGDYIAAIDYNYRLFDRADYIDMYDGTNMDLDVYTVEDYMTDGIHLSKRGRGAYAAVIAQLIDKKRGIITKEYQQVTIDDY